MKSPRGLFAMLLALAVTAGCSRPHEGSELAAALPGDPDRGAALIEKVDCGVCHRIPGILRARGRVGPPLTNFAQRAFIAGQVPNSPETLVRWIQNPPSIAPDTAMPVLGISEGDARDIAAYLYTLN